MTPKLIDINPAIAAALLKAPHASGGGTTLKAAAKDLSAGVHYVTGVVKIAGHIRKANPPAPYLKNTVNNKAVANVLNWALQRLNATEYSALIRDLDAIMGGDQRDDSHPLRVAEVVKAVTKTTTVQPQGSVTWAGTITIDDLNVFEGNGDDITATGLTLCVGGE